jgi:hypothetical protein
VRTLLRVSIALAALFAVASHRVVAGSGDFASSLTAAMTPYYGALVASARNDGESTQRHLVIFRARWAEVKQAQDSAPEALTNDPEWQPTIARIDGFVARAEALVHARNLHDAHREIEGVRLALHAVRARHGLETLDDRLTEYHESMERIVTRASMYNEIVLADADYAELTKDLARAGEQWAVMVRSAGPLTDDPAWQEAARRSMEAQAELARLIAARDEAAISHAADTMKNAYLDLLDVMARVKR